VQTEQRWQLATGERGWSGGREDFWKCGEGQEVAERVEQSARHETKRNCRAEEKKAEVS
jgi:hypothetical protein